MSREPLSPLPLGLNPLVLYRQHHRVKRRGCAVAIMTIGAALVAILVLLLLLEGPKMRQGILGMMAPERARRYARVAHEIDQSVTGYMVGDILTSVIAGVVVFFTLLALGIPFPLLWAL